MINLLGLFLFLVKRAIFGHIFLSDSTIVSQVLCKFIYVYSNDNL